MNALQASIYFTDTLESILSAQKSICRTEVSHYFDLVLFLMPF